MGVAIKIKNVDFSMCGMGTITDSMAHLSERVQKFVDKYNSYDTMSVQNVLALSNLDKKIDSVYGKIRAFYPFIGTKSNTLGLDLINPSVQIQGMPAKTSDVYVPRYVDTTVKADSSFYKNIGAIIYNNAPCEEEGNINAILRAPDWFNMWSKIQSSKDCHIYNAFQTQLYTNSGVSNFGATQRNANGVLAFFAGKDKMVAYMEKAKFEANYNSTYIDNEDVVNNTITIGERSFPNITPLSLVVITTGDVTDEEYIIMHDAISEFVKNKDNTTT